jgi:Nitronate monooxygenase
MCVPPRHTQSQLGKDCAQRAASKALAEAKKVAASRKLASRWVSRLRRRAVAERIGDNGGLLPHRNPRPSMKTRITELFGIQHPIIQGGMHFVGLPELASAVSNAGGLGMITALTLGTPEKLAAAIKRCHEMTVS